MKDVFVVIYIKNTDPIEQILKEHNIEYVTIQDLYMKRKQIFDRNRFTRHRMILKRFTNSKKLWTVNGGIIKMKYGILSYSSCTPNIGDLYQLNGIKRVYRKLGINEEDIIKIDRDYLAKYDGDYVILPITSFVDVLPGTHIFPLSPRIIPVFIGMHCIDDQHLAYLSKYRHFGPFGCRDEVTMRKLRQNGLDAYMSGCLSICTQKRPVMPTQTKVFLVDVSDELRKHIPESLLKDAVEVTHEFSLHQYKCADERAYIESKAAEEMLERYKNEARLIITSRLHCALPCTAMGIPVIVGREMNEHRFGGMDKVLNYYNESEYDKIDFAPEPIDLEWLKKKILALAEYMITSTYEKYYRLCDVSQFYEQRTNKIYYAGIKDSYLTLQQKQAFYEGKTYEKEILSYISGKKIEELTLIVYGAGDKGKWMAVRYREKMNKFKKVIFVDTKKAGENFFGHVIQPAEIIAEMEPEKLMIIIAADNYYSGAGKSIGESLINNYHLKEGKEFFFLDKLNNSMNMPLDVCGTVESWADGM